MTVQMNYSNALVLLNDLQERNVKLQATVQSYADLLFEFELNRLKNYERCAFCLGGHLHIPESTCAAAIIPHALAATWWYGEDGRARTKRDDDKLRSAWRIWFTAK